MLEAADSGKPRLRSQLTPQFQIGRLAASMLLLPDPRRSFKGTGEAEPVAIAKKYILSRVGFGPDTEFADIPDMVTIDPSFVMLENLTDKETIGVQKRWQRIEGVYERSDELPADIRNPLVAHRSALASGETITSALVTTVARLSRATAAAIDGYSAGDDPLPGLELVLDISPDAGPLLPPPNEIGEEEPEVSARAAHEYRLAKTRGAAGRKFALAVRTAYGDRCALCGAKYGGFDGIRSGIDAAHILAWSNYDLDVVSNGLALCKLHHWAFDAALLMPIYEGNALTLRFTELSSQFDAPTLAKLGQHGFVIPEEWLPADASKHPNETYLDRLYADLAVTWLA